MPSSSSLKKTRSVPEPGSGSHRLVQQPPPPPAPRLSPVPPPPPVAPVYAPRPPIPTPDAPREDLTERLRKEFGLTIEDSEEGEEGSDTEPAGGAALDFPDSVNSVASAHRPANHVAAASATATASDANQSGWSAAGRGVTANYGSQQRVSGSPNGGGSSSYWADVNYRNSFRPT